MASSLAASWAATYSETMVGTKFSENWKVAETSG